MKLPCISLEKYFFDSLDREVISVDSREYLVSLGDVHWISFDDKNFRIDIKTDFGLYYKLNFTKEDWEAFQKLLNYLAGEIRNGN